LVWGLAKTDQEWSEQLYAALTATRRDDLAHGTNAAFVAGYLGWRASQLLIMSVLWVA
jgi:hypothetical protein